MPVLATCFAAVPTAPSKPEHPAPVRRSQLRHPLGRRGNAAVYLTTRSQRDDQ